MRNHVLPPEIKVTAIVMVLLAILTSEVKANSFSPGFIVKNDGTRLEGDIMFNNITPGFVLFKGEWDIVTTYTAEQLLSFGIDWKGEFVSRIIHYRNGEQNVFLFRVIKGEYSYLHLNHKPDRFFIEHADGTLSEITSDNFEETFAQLAGWCPRWSNQLRHSKPRHNKVKTLIGMVNNNQCRALPFSSVGIIAGSSGLTHHLNNYFFKESYIFDTSLSRNTFTAGFWYERPVWSMPAFSIRYAAIVYQHRKLTAFYPIEAERFKEFEAERTDVNFSVLPTFNINLSAIIRPYLFAGAIGTINHSQHGLSVETWIFEGGNSQDYPREFSLSKYGVGYAAGAGVHFYYLPNRYLAAEVQYLKLFFEKGHQADGLQLNLKINIFTF